MSKNKRQSREIPTPEVKNNSCRFIFTSGGASLENLIILNESIKRIKKEFQNYCNFFILDSTSHLQDRIAEENALNPGSFAESPIVIISKPSDIIQSSDTNNSFCIWLDLSLLKNHINFNDFFKAEILSPSLSEYYRLNWENGDISAISGWILNTESSGNLLNHLAISGHSDSENALLQIRRINLKQKFLSINQSSPFIKKNIFSAISSNPISILRKFNAGNLKNLLQVGHLFGVTTKGSGINRILFFVIALLSFVILPLISYNAGISGDEEKHYNQAVKVYNYFDTGGKDTSSLSDEKYKLNYYGQSFDLLTYVLIKKLHISKVYEARHVMNGIIGALTIFCSGLLARILLGNIAGIFTMLLLFFSPGFLGHAMNNPLDIPFAFGYIFTLLQLTRFLKRLPEINYGIAVLIALGIAFTISIRVGGLVLIPYIFMFSGLYLLFNEMPWKSFTMPWMRLAGKGVLVLSGISVAAYFISILPWPYALQKPLKNPFEAMKIMENITVSLRVMFDGKIIWSDTLPASYIPKSILLSIPLLVLAGFTIPIAFIRKNRNAFWVFFLLWAVVFPVVYIIYKESNVYGAWRHLLFIYPPMVILAGIGMQSIYNLWENLYFKIGIIAVFTAGMINPAAHIIRNYPNQYIYFNEIAGGVKTAYKKYETDYYMVSLKPGTQWIKDNILKTLPVDSLNPVRIVSNAPSDIMNYYFREDKNKVKLLYTRYYDRGLYDWDYAIFFCNYIDPYQITHNIWPPKNTIHTVTIDGVKICAVVKRENKDDHEGFELLNSSIKTRSKPDLDESIRLMENALLIDKHNEITYLNIAQAYILREEFDTARKKLNDLLTFYPNYEKALNLIGYAYLNEGEILNDKMKIERAISIFNEVLKINYKFASGYHNLGLAFMIKGDDDTAFSYFQKSIDNNAQAKDSYFMMANILEKRGDSKQAREIREFVKGL